MGLLLLPVDFAERVRIAPNFSFGDLSVYIRQIEESCLPDIVGAERLADYYTWLNTNQPPNTIMTALDALVRPYAIYAVWSAYISENGFQPTLTGIVVKTNEYSDPISDAQRTELRRKYADLALFWAGRIRKYIDAIDKTNCECNTCTSSCGSRIGKVVSKQVSYFD